MISRGNPARATPGGPTAPEQSFQWLRPLLPRRLQPWLRGLRKRWAMRALPLEEPFRTVYPFTQVSAPRQKNLLELGAAIDRERLPGAIVECGVLDGGTAALMAYATSASQRPVHLFDAWQGLPDCTDEDGADARKWVGQVVGSPRRVAQVMDRVGVARERVHMHKGWFHETLPHAGVEQVALLHIDCDFYGPTRLCLDHWYPRLVPGGFVQIDDYTDFHGCRQAVDEFLAEHPELHLELTEGPGRATYLRRPA